VTCRFSIALSWCDRKNSTPMTIFISFAVSFLFSYFSILSTCSFEHTVCFIVQYHLYFCMFETFYSIQQFLADCTALLASYCHLSVCLWCCALWLNMNMILQLSTPSTDPISSNSPHPKISKFNLFVIACFVDHMPSLFTLKANCETFLLMAVMAGMWSPVSQWQLCFLSV